MPVRVPLNLRHQEPLENNGATGHLGQYAIARGVFADSFGIKRREETHGRALRLISVLTRLSIALFGFAKDSEITRVHTGDLNRAEISRADL